MWLVGDERGKEKEFISQVTRFGWFDAIRGSKGEMKWASCWVVQITSSPFHIQGTMVGGRKEGRTWWWTKYKQ